MTGIIPRFTLFIAVLVVLLLTGCAHLRTGDGLTRSAVTNDDVTLRAVLAFANEQSRADSEAREATRKQLEGEPVSPVSLMKLAMIHGQNRDDANPAKAAALLEKVLADASPEAATLHPLARILHSQCLARVRLEGQNERLLAEVRSSQTQVKGLQDELGGLQDKLNALTDIERSLRSPSR